MVKYRHSFSSLLLTSGWGLSRKHVMSLDPNKGDELQIVKVNGLLCDVSPPGGEDRDSFACLKGN